jgi:hypothetical protein
MFKRSLIEGVSPPAGSRVVAAGEYDEYRIEIFDGSDGHGYFVVYPKLRDRRGRPILAQMAERASMLAREAFRTAPTRCGVVETVEEEPEETCVLTQAP